MNSRAQEKIIVIGGSAGSFHVLLQLVKSLPDDFALPIVIVIHRQRNVTSEFTRIIAQTFRDKKIVEPDDKESISASGIYIAPQNYHLLFEAEGTFSLDYSEAVKFSRPSIDVTFESAARIYKNNLIAILLSGANNDGTTGLHCVAQHGGTMIVQDPLTAEFPAMPRAAIASVPRVQVFDPAGIIAYLTSVNINKNIVE